VLRYAGDEFLVVAAGLDRDAVEQRVERLRWRLRKAVGQVPFFSFSVGISTLEAGGDPEAALQAADQRMYQTKGKIAV
jgi:PleD family two-component response regulator